MTSAGGGGGRCAVLGAGSWGTTLALHLAARGERVALWEVDADRAAEVARTRFSRPFLPAHALPPEIAVTADLSAALAEASMVVLAVPSHVMRETATRLGALGAEQDAGGRLWVSATKGIEEGTRGTLDRRIGWPELRGRRRCAPANGSSGGERDCAGGGEGSGPVLL